MSNIIVENNPSQKRLQTLAVSKWPTWQKEVSVFPWVFPEQEMAYIVEGECIITPQGVQIFKVSVGVHALPKTFVFIYT